MRHLLVAMILTVPTLGWGAANAKGNQCGDEQQFPGPYMKWVMIAEPVFQKQHLNLDKYNIVILDEPETVTVLLRSTDATCEGRGSTGSRPDFDVQISKKNGKIVQFSYVK